MTENITVSICMITYNHEKYIAQAIEGVLMQKTNFSFELVIGEDCSTDNTASLIRDYQQRYPNIIKARFNSPNMGMMPNAILTLQECTGKYIAMCEGDDYWIDPFKLQKQVDFLEANSDYAICYHNTEERIVSNSFAPSFLYNSLDQKETSTIYDLAYSNFISTCSVVYRNNLFNEFPHWLNDISIGDWSLHFLNAQFGKIYYIPHVMSVHRIHSGGVWSLQDKRKSYSLSINLLNMIQTTTNDKLLISHLELGKQNLNNIISQLDKEKSKLTNKESCRLKIIRSIKLITPPIFISIGKWIYEFTTRRL